MSLVSSSCLDLMEDGTSVEHSSICLHFSSLTVNSYLVDHHESKKKQAF